MFLSDRAISNLLLAVLVAVPVSTFLISKSRKASSIGGRLALILLALLLSLVALVGTVVYAIPAFEEFKSASPFAEALLGNMLCGVSAWPLGTSPSVSSRVRFGKEFRKHETCPKAGSHFLARFAQL
jgi:uncharacterized membrane protein YkvI